MRFRVPRPDHPVTHVVEDAVRDLRWADVRRTLREDFVLVRRDGAPLYALCAVVCPRGSSTARACSMAWIYATAWGVDRPVNAGLESAQRPE